MRYVERVVEPAENLGSGSLVAVAGLDGEDFSFTTDASFVTLFDDVTSFELIESAKWSLFSVRLGKGPSTALPVVTELGRYRPPGLADDISLTGYAG